jgi:cytochrome c peroxidase
MKSPSFATLSFARRWLSRWLLAGAGVCVAAGVVLVHFWPAGEPQTAEASTSPPIDSNEPIQPIEPIKGLDPRKIDLGRRLFQDSRLSHNNQVSCESCHSLETGGTDRQTRSVGINGVAGGISAPTVLNSAFNFRQFWDGRAATLESQIDGPLQSNIEMGSTWPEVIRKLKQSPAYVRDFRQVYGDDIRIVHVKDSIAEFERSLSTPNSRFDRYLRHQANAITSRELQGYTLFKSFGCASCHQGMNAGGNMYQKVGVMAPYFTDRGHINKADLGRFNVTGDPQDMYMFKVPSLRNVALTPPYFHDGSAPTLTDAVRMMAKYQLGRRLSDEEVESIVEFLKTLTGELNGKPL